jgi:ribosomal-protein-serine acetyltransferase
VNPILWQIDDDAVVRTFVPDDADVAFAAVDANRERLHRWMPWEERTRSPADTRTFIERANASENDLEGNGIWVGPEFAGAIGMRINTESQSAELGYWLTEAFEGRGLMTKACRLFINHAFGELGLHRVTIQAGTENVRSRAVAERLGFTLEGTLRDAGRVGGGHYVDLAVYGLLENEWRS